MDHSLYSPKRLLRMVFFLLLACPMISQAASKETADNGSDPWDSPFSEAEIFYQEGLNYGDEGNWLKAEESFDLALNAISETPAMDFKTQVRKKKYANLIVDALAEISAEALATQISDTSQDYGYGEAELPTDSNTQYLLHHLVDGIDLGQYEMPIEINDRVIREMYRFAYGNTKGFTQSSLRRMLRYQTYIQDRLREEGMPKELIYLAFVESGFSAGAQSPAKASGVWQFIPSTGKMYGLDINWWMDERRDPYEATNAAINYLKKLYRDFGDWYLAMAAYNCGEGCVKRALKNSSSTSYWDLPLPQETKNYVPRILAVTIIATNPERYEIKTAGKPLPFPDTLSIPGCVALGKISVASRIPEDTLILLNPELRQKISPPNSQYTLKLPIGSRKQVSTIIKEQINDLTSCTQKYKVQRDESLVDISKKFGVSIDQILSVNNSGNSFQVKLGQSLTIPSPVYGVNVDSLIQVSELKYGPTDLVRQPAILPSLPDYHIVKKGESLRNIAAKYNLDPADIRRWNRMKGITVSRGQRLWIKAPLIKEDSVELSKPEIFSPKEDRFEEIRSKKDRKLIEKPKEVQVEDEPVRSEIDKKFRKSVIKEKIRHIYTVRPRETLESIAVKLGLSVSNLRDWNRLSSRSRLRAGQDLTWYEEKGITVFEPQRDVQNSSKSSSSKSKSTYIVVKKGQTLASIAYQNGVSIENLVAWNDLRMNSKVKLGQKLILEEPLMEDEKALLKSKVDAKHKSSNEVESKLIKVKTKPIRYQVRRGDTMNSISKKFGVSTADLMKWNKLRSKMVAIGSTLVIQKEEK